MNSINNVHKKDSHCWETRYITIIEPSDLNSQVAFDSVVVCEFCKPQSCRMPLGKFLRQEIANNPGLLAVSCVRNSYRGLKRNSILRGGFQDVAELPLRPSPSLSYSRLSRVPIPIVHLVGDGNREVSAESSKFSGALQKSPGEF